jgi:hypothetical protein
MAALTDSCRFPFAAIGTISPPISSSLSSGAMMPASSMRSRSAMVKARRERPSAARVSMFMPQV